MEKIENPKIIDQSFTYPSFTIVIEWGRFLQTDEVWRARTMLQRLCEQILQVSKKISNGEILIIFDPEEIDGSEVETFAKKQLSPCINIIKFRLIPSLGLLSYEMKNFGAEKSSNELILLVDSDVIIDDGWLVGYLESFKDPEVNVVSGNTYLCLNTLVEKVLGLVSFIPLPDVDHMYEKYYFHGQNVAFRRNVFLAHPFPKLNSFHGQCSVLINELISNNIKIYRQPKCRTAHPMPVTLRQFVMWGLVQGLCWSVKLRAYRMGVKSNSYIKNNDPGTFQQIIARTRKRFRYVGLSPAVFFGACGILPAYFLLIFFGIIIASIRPNYYNFIIRKKWRMWL